MTNYKPQFNEIQQKYLNEKGFMKGTSIKCSLPLFLVYITANLLCDWGFQMWQEILFAVPCYNCHHLTN